MDVVIKLISYGANPDVHVQLGNDHDKFSFAASCSGYDYDKDKTGVLEEGDTPLHFAVKTDNKALALVCLEKKPGMVNSVNSKNKTPAHTAIKVLSPEMAHLLKTNGAELELFKEIKGTDKRKNTLLMEAAGQFGSDKQLYSFFSEDNYQLSEKQKEMREKVLQKYNYKSQRGNVLMFQVGLVSKDDDVHLGSATNIVSYKK